MKGFFFRFIVIPGMLLVLIRSCFGGAMGSEAMSVNFFKGLLVFGAFALIMSIWLKIAKFIEDDPDSDKHTEFIFTLAFMVFMMVFASCSVPVFFS